MAETLQGCRLPEPPRSSLCRTQVALLRKQEGDSNRRTKTTKIKITDPCFRGRSASIPAADHKPVLVQRNNRRRTSILRRGVAWSCRDRRESGEPVGPTE